MPGEIKGKDEYLSLTEGLLRKGKGKEALMLLKHAVSEIPRDPFILSYYGCLTAMVERKASIGAKTCMDAINIFKKSQALGGFVYPVFYLNLGRCYLVGGDKKKALDAFNRGLKMDPEYPDLKNEIKKLGMRKKPPITFLPRGNPLNKYIGLLLSKMKG